MNGIALPRDAGRRLPLPHLPFAMLRHCLALLVLSSVMIWAAPNAPTTTGTIEGRVVNQNSGEYLEHARVSVEGTELQTFSDADGFYRIVGVPAGTARLTGFFTGLAAEHANVTVAPGATAVHEVRLAPAGTTPGDNVVKLSEFVVEASKEMTGSAIAINEQRFAPNTQNVVSTDEFGFVAESNAAEFIKYVPGVTVTDQGGNGRWISINGVPTDNVPVTLNGFNLASTGGDAATNQPVEVDMVSINTLSRIEVAYSPTPESQGAALAGSVNMVARSAFERKKPVLNVTGYMMMRDDSKDFNRTPGPYSQRTPKVHPGFDLSYIAPVNDRFGYTVTAGTSAQYCWEIASVNTWRGVQSATNGTTFPDTTPDKPYLSAYAVADRPKMTWRNAVGATFDYKVARNDRLSLSLQGSNFEESNTNRTLTFNVGRVLPDQFSTTYTHGAAGAGSLQITAIRRQRANHTFMPSLTWRHEGPIWKAEAGLGHSHQSQHYRDIDQGYFRTMTINRSAVTINFDDNFYLRPGRITVLDATGTLPVDPYDLGNYAVASAISNQRDATDVQRTAYANIARDVGWRVPFTLKAGVDIRDSMRDLRGVSPTYTFVGKDGKTSTTPIGSDDGAAPFLNPNSLARPGPFGFPIIEWPDPKVLWQYYQQNPSSFTRDANGDYRGAVGLSKRAQQTVSSTYLRGDLLTLDRRLKLVGGVRAEQTNIHAEGPLTDPTRDFQRDAQGNIVRDAKNSPVLIVPTNAGLPYSQLTHLDRGQHTKKEYLRFFPSLNASYNIRENLIARAAGYYSVGRPDYDQYAGGLTLPNTDTDPSSSNVIRVNNAGIKAWQAKSVSFRLEYYFERVGQISVGCYRRDIKDFFGQTIFTATPSFLAFYNLDPGTYGRYDVVTNYNLPGTVRMEGYDINYKQALTFLPQWARGIQVFANGAVTRAVGEGAGNFAGFVPKSASWGISLTRPKYNLRANWHYNSETRNNAIAAGRSIEPGTYNYTPRQLTIDLMGEYLFYRRWGAFFNLRNFRDDPLNVAIYGPHTPSIARYRQRTDYGSLWTFGLKTTL